MSEQRNLVVAIGLSLAILIGFNFFYEKPKYAEAIHHAEIAKNTSLNSAITADKDSGPAFEVSKVVDRSQALSTESRIIIQTPKLHGSINLKGARLDDITLAEYHETTDPKSSEIMLLSPQNTKGAYFADFGWQGQGKLPDANTVWKVKGDANITAVTLTCEHPVTLTFDNGAGLRFERTFSVDENYLFTINDKVVNSGHEEIKLQPYGRITRVGTPQTSGYYILHEGAIGVVQDRLKEFDYSKLIKEKEVIQTSTGGWVGFTDKYWLVALVSDQSLSVQTRFSGTEAEMYRAEINNGEHVLKPGASLDYKQYLFSGAKVLRLLDAYEEKQGFKRFDLAVDFGWFYFVTKPLFYVLEFLHQLLGNLGVAILVLTVFVKILFYPLANKSFNSMARMKIMQPQMEKIKQKYANDKMRMNQELMELYKREKINPMSGCLPMLIQAPIFFCLYKVFFVTIEMRHAPFFGWIHDLSAPDPTSFFNLFGLLPWDAPSFLTIGALPLLMGATMILQQRLNPQPVDATQAKIMLIMPLMFTYLFASFPAGLVIYWAWSNILSIAQQMLITHRASSTAPVKTKAKKR
ncbi:MAG: membrane protein insertase YidC [Alphaproteobacteria bacterium]|jgi:YidC/Oxa1 family membrane protein insertase|nr:membrane protein insertase YidC [Alphaproteobacteria bacterium]